MTAGSSGRARVAPVRQTRHEAHHQPERLVERRNRGPYVLEVDDADGDCLRTLGVLKSRDYFVQLALLDEAARRDDRPYLRSRAGGAQIGETGREVQHRNDPPERSEAEEGQCHGIHIREQDSHDLAGPHTCAAASGREQRPPG